MLFLEQYFDQMLCQLTYVWLHSLGIKRGVWFVRLFKVKKFDLRTYVLPVFEITL